MSHNCSICAEPFTSKVRAPVTCPYCAHLACLQCCQTYLQSVATDPHCMNPECRADWNHDFMDTTFSAAFRSGPLKEARKQILLSRERSLFPDTQNFVAAKRKLEQLQQQAREHSERLAEIRKEERATKRKKEICEAGIQSINATYMRGSNGDDVQHVVDWVQSVVNEPPPEDPNLELEWRRFGRRPPARTDMQPGTMRRRVVACPCPGEGCMGFVWRDNMTCGTCEKRLCGECNAPLDEKTLPLGPGSHDTAAADADADVDSAVAVPVHVCNRADVESARAIAHDSKPCPKCAVPIFRISGCSEMFCTNCHVSFNWNSLEISSTPGHNPHLMEFLSQQRRDGTANAQPAQERAACRGDAMPDLFRGHMYRLTGRSYLADGGKVLRDVVGLHNHIQRWLMLQSEMLASAQFYAHHGRPPSSFDQRARGAHGQANEHDPTGNLELRVRFLQGRMTEEQFATALQQREKKARKGKALYDALDTFCTVARDLVWEVEQRTHDNRVASDRKALREFVTRIQTLVDFCNKSFVDTCKAFFVKSVPKITLRDETDGTKTLVFEHGVIYPGRSNWSTAR